MDILRTQHDLTIGDCEPYVGHFPGDSTDVHALRHGRPNVLIELRNDLIADAAEQQEWAERLAPVLETALTQTQL